MKKIIACFALTGLLFACKQPEPRKPVSYSSGTFIKESVQRNKNIVQDEEKLIQNVIKKDSAHHYYQSTLGFWYKYDVAVTTDSLLPKKGDIVKLDFEIYDINNNLIYTKAETTPKVYAVDKQEIMVGLRHAVKLMHKGETVSFIFPSHMAYGYLGDKEKIGTNVPLICKVTLNDIKPE
ncbi:MAG: gliding motility-associated peptidyl-prolyl isomerase GldI [Myroides sp.]